MSYGYHNEKMRKSLEWLMEEFKDACSGRNISIGSLTKDRQGEYSDEKLMALLDELVDADIKDSDWVYLDTDRHAKETDYIKTLLYVIIRANQSRLSKVVAGKSGRIARVEPVHDDSFAGILSQLEFTPVEYRFGGGKRIGVVSPSARATAETIYLMLTGEKMSFPSPYTKKEEKVGKEESPAEDETIEAETAVPDEQAGSEDSFNDVMDYDDPDFGDYCGWDPTEGMTPEEADEYYRAEQYSSLRAYEQSCFYGTNDDGYIDWKSREDYEADQMEEEEEMSELYRYVIDPDDPEKREEYEKYVKRLKVLFEDGDAYISMYKHLAEITTPDCVEYEGMIEAKIDAYLKENNKTIYSDDAGFNSVFEILYTAVDEAKKIQRKKV